MNYCLYSHLVFGSGDRPLLTSRDQYKVSLQLQAGENFGIQEECTAFVASLRACIKNKDSFTGNRIYSDIVKRGLFDQCSDALVIMYAKWGMLEKAQVLRDICQSTDVFCWNALLSGYVREGKDQNALDCFDYMQHEGIDPDAVTYACILKACAAAGSLEKGRLIHVKIVQQNLLQSDVVLGNSLLVMYVKCGALSNACYVFDELLTRDVVTWSTLISGHEQQGQCERALACFKCMQHEGVLPNAVTYVSILKACGAGGATDKGKLIHDRIVEQGLLHNDTVLGTSLVDMYAKCGALLKAERVFEEVHSRNVVTWSALIAGYVQKGQYEPALSSVKHMWYEGIHPNAVTYVSILKACGGLGAADMGEQIHGQIMRQQLLQNNVALGNALVDMYVKCGLLSMACHVLESLPSRNATSWNTLIAGYAEEGQGEQLLNSFGSMQNEGISPDAATYVCILKACGDMGFIDKGKQIHDQVVRRELLQGNLILGNALVDMYAKCGVLSRAQSMLEELPSRDIITWSAVITGYSQEGQGERALQCFECMHGEGISPDVVTCVSLLNVYSHLGLLVDGVAFFMNMVIKYGVQPDLECYTCMVDLFGRGGRLIRAVNLVQEVPFSGCTFIWHALLGACQKWEDVNIGRWAFEQALHLDRSDASVYVLMANVYAAADMKQDANNMLSQ